MTSSTRFLPESVPWLCANNRVEEAEKIIRHAANMNGISMPDRILSIKPPEEDDNDVTTPAGATAEGVAVSKNSKDGDGSGVKQQQQQSAKDRFVSGIRSRMSNMRHLKKSGNKEEEEHAARYTLLDVFRNRRLTIYAISMAILWSVIDLLHF